MTGKTFPQFRCVGLLVFTLWVAGTTVILAKEGQSSTSDIPPPIGSPNLASLNIRLSQRPISPPENLVKGKVDIANVQAARMLVGPSPQAAILEDDHHQRVMVLSALENGQVQAQLLADIDLSSKIPFITACAEDRECAYDRRPVTGGLGCIAICVQQALSPNQTP